jgi:hypothetical protein
MHPDDSIAKPGDGAQLIGPPALGVTNGEDPGDLTDRVDTVVLRVRIVIYHRGLDGAPHIPGDEIERITADLLPAELWRGGYGK